MSASPELNGEAIRQVLVELGEAIADGVRDILQRKPVEERTRVVRDIGCDLIYQLDVDVEHLVERHLEERAAGLGGVVLIAEGIGKNDRSVFPKGFPDERAALRLLMDPIDGTRGLMYEKRSGFFLAGAAPNRGEGTRLRDIELAVMVELPSSRAGVADTLWARRGGGARGTTRDLHDGSTKPFQAQPSGADSIEGGFTQFSRFFPPGLELIARIEESMLRRIFPDMNAGQLPTFGDQFLSTGGQLYELIAGRDRLCVELRAAVYRHYRSLHQPVARTCHPYDLAAVLVAEESGVIVTDLRGGALDAPMDTHTEMDWIGYANPVLRAQVEPALRSILQAEGLSI